MTIGLAWIRKHRGAEELVIASDSRLGAHFTWDQSPKIMTFPRSDVAICFAGGTHYAYPLILQLYMAINSYTSSRERAMDIHDLRGHALKVINSLQMSMYNFPSIKGQNIKDQELQATELILGGYSWKQKKFSMWRFHYESSKGLYEIQPSTNFLGKFGPILFIGDWAKEAEEKLVAQMKDKFGADFSSYDGESFNLEPMEVLRDLLQNAKSTDTIGGPPQVVTVYQHMNCRPVGVIWNDKKTVLGRTLFDYENVDCTFLDPNTLQFSR